MKHQLIMADRESVDRIQAAVEVGISEAECQFRASLFDRVGPIYPTVRSAILDTANGSYLIVEKVIYMCICDSSYPRKLAFSYLDELSKEFQRSYEGKIETVTRPYAFMGFGRSCDSGVCSNCSDDVDTFISKTTRLYKDSRTLTQGAGPSQPPTQLDQLNDNLKDVTRIMTKNMEDLLWRGDSLDREPGLMTMLILQECHTYPLHCARNQSSIAKQQGISTCKLCYGNGLQ